MACQDLVPNAQIMVIHIWRFRALSQNSAPSIDLPHSRKIMLVRIFELATSQSQWQVQVNSPEDNSRSPQWNYIHTSSDYSRRNSSMTLHQGILLHLWSMNQRLRKHVPQNHQPNMVMILIIHPVEEALPATACWCDPLLIIGISRTWLDESCNVPKQHSSLSMNNISWVDGYGRYPVVAS